MSCGIASGRRRSPRSGADVIARHDGPDLDLTRRAVVVVYVSNVGRRSDVFGLDGQDLDAHGALLSSQVTRLDPPRREARQPIEPSGANPCHLHRVRRLVARHGDLEGWPRSRWR